MNMQSTKNETSELNAPTNIKTHIYKTMRKHLAASKFPENNGLLCTETEHEASKYSSKNS